MLEAAARAGSLTVAGEVKLTREGLERLKAQLVLLKAKRSELREAVRATRADGDLSENFPYHAAREELSIVETQIAGLEYKLGRAEVLPEGAVASVVTPGFAVTVECVDTGRVTTYTLVDGAEVNHVEGGLSVESPLGDALLGLEVGDLAEAETPRGLRRLRVVEVG